MNLKTAFLTGAVLVAITVAAACSGTDDPAPQSSAQSNMATASVEQPAASSAAVAAAQPSPSSALVAAGASTRINLNSATREQFLTVPGVGDRMVRELEEYRPYTSVAQFRREIGKYVSQEQVAAYLQYLYVPVDANRADAETLQQLPGIDAADAAALIAARPYASAEAFLAALGRYASADQVTAARTYLATS